MITTDPFPSGESLPEEREIVGAHLAEMCDEMARLRAEVARLTVESEGRRAVLECKAEELRQEWMRAEAAEAEAARYREALEEIRRHAQIYSGWYSYNLARRALLTTEGGDRA